MLDAWNTLFSSDSFIPHGHCYLWEPGLVWLHVISDILIAVAYYSIPLTLLYFVRKREDLPFDGIFLLFGAFIVSCGTTHLMEVWTLWHPIYWASGALKAMTASVSLFTAIQLIPIVPKALALPSPAQLTSANQQLEAQIFERIRAEKELKQYQDQLEQLVAERTQQLATSNTQLEEILGREQEARRQTEVAKAELQRQLVEIEAIYESAPIGLCVLDTDLRFIRINDFLAEINGVAASGHLGRTVREVLPELGEVQEDIFRKVLQQGEPVLNQEVHGTIPSKPEIERDWLVNYYPLRSEGNLLGINVTVQEITEQKRTEKAIQERVDELAHLNAILSNTTALLQERNRDLDQFAYVVSHDLKAPLRAIANLSVWIEEDLMDQIPPDNQQQLNLLRQRVYRMEALINGLLEYSRVGRIETRIETVNVNDLLNEVVDSLSPPPTFAIEISPDMPSLQARRLLLSQVFSNLISNAIKHHDRPNGTISITAHDKGNIVEFTVSDDGPGIEERYHEKIFSIFQTLKARDEQENTGVGLSIVKKIVETEGGTITLKSQLGKGTTFQFTWLKHPRRPA